MLMKFFMTNILAEKILNIILLCADRIVLIWRMGAIIYDVTLSKNVKRLVIKRRDVVSNESRLLSLVFPIGKL